MIFLQITSLFYIIGCFKNPKIAFRIGFIILLAIPTGSTNILMEYIDVLNIGNSSINLYHLVIISLFLLTIVLTVKNKDYEFFKLNKSTLLIFSISVMMVVLNLAIGFSKGYDFISDGQKYIMFVMWILTIFYMYKKYGYNSFVKDTCIALLINFSCIIVMNLFFDKFSFLLIDNIALRSQETRFVSYAANISILPILLLIHLVSNKMLKKTKTHIYICICTIVSIISNIFFASNRTLVLILLISSAIIFLRSNTFLLFNTKTKLKWIVGCLIFMVIIIIILYLTGNQLVIRILNTNFFNIDRNLVTRINTILYYAPLIFTSPIGYGFGRTIPLINQSWRFHGVSNFTDNGFINVGMKTGLIGLLIFMLLVILACRIILKNYKKSTDNYWLSIFIIFLAFIFSGCIMTGQIMNNYPMTFFFGMLLVDIFQTRNSVDGEL